MRKIAIAFTAGAATLLFGALALPAYAQPTQGAAAISETAKNFTPIQKAACGPFHGRWCGPFHHRVCGPYRCWCARC